MSVEVKILEGYYNRMSRDRNSLSLLVKSDFSLSEHIKVSKEKILASLNVIASELGDSCDLYFFHRVMVPQILRTTGADYVRAKSYHMSGDKLKNNIKRSLKELVTLDGNCKRFSHFVNIQGLEDDGKVIILSKKRFITLTQKIRNSLSKLRNTEYMFTEDEDIDLMRDLGTKIDDTNKRYLKLIDDMRGK